MSTDSARQPLVTVGMLCGVAALTVVHDRIDEATGELYRQGWAGCLDRLLAYVGKRRRIAVTAPSRSGIR
jgi:hypothetical protein